MKKLWVSHISALAALAVFTVLVGLACGSTPTGSNSGTSGPTFPSEFMGTWKRDDFSNTLTFTANTLKSSSQEYNWSLQGISSAAYTIKSSRSNSTVTFTIRQANNNLVISGDSGDGENNWNGTWYWQSGTTGSGSAGNSTAQQSAAQYWTGDGGRGMRLGILVPHSQGLNANQDYLPTLIQGVLVSNVAQYSAISVLDRVALDRVITETLDLTYEDDFDIVSLGHVTQAGYIMTGDIIKTSTGFSLQINVTDTTPQAKTVASYSGTCTAAELDNHSAIRQASLELLTQMNVRLTTRARNELTRASAQESINAQAALAQGITAQRQGSEVAALSYFLQASEFDPSLQEAEIRLESISAVITSGNMGSDIRNDIQWRTQWLARLRETEQFIANYMKGSPNYYLVYSSSVTQGVVDYVRETITLSLELRCSPEPMNFETINKLARTIRSGLMATGRAETWGINWPSQSVTTPSPFFATASTYPVVVELLNAAGKSVGRQSANLTIGGWFMPDGGALSGTTVPYLRTQVKVDFPGVDVKDIDNITISVTTINNIPAERAATQMGLRILPQDEYDNIQSVMDNGLQIANLGLFDIRSDQGKNIVGAYRGSTYAVIPYGVSYVDRNSGLRSKGLTSLKLPSSVTIIGDNAFDGNLLTSVTIPDSVTAIGGGVFLDNRMTSVFIGSSVTSIGGSAFRNNRLTSVTIPDSVTSFPTDAFNDNSLRSITIGANVNVYDSGTFSSSPFYIVYNENNRKAGTYTHDGSKWNYGPRR
jgi:hypothetical protein